jgi:hypothetical protein
MVRTSVTSYSSSFTRDKGIPSAPQYADGATMLAFAIGFRKESRSVFLLVACDL